MGDGKMKTPAVALLLLAGLLWALPAADSAFSLIPPSGKKVVVAKGGVTLYPRYNKSLKPITVLKEGETIEILKELRAWKYVQVNAGGQKGWVLFTVTKTSQKTGTMFDTVAAPSTAGLVAKGWSKDYASRHGADYSKVEEIKKRTLDPDRFNNFLEGEDN
jgi:hypothetical protein